MKFLHVSLPGFSENPLYTIMTHKKHTEAHHIDYIVLDHA